MSRNKTIYLDNHATTATDQRVVDAMLPYFTEIYGNPGSRSHSLGMEARSAVEQARRQVASLVGCAPKEVVFTSGATESNNIAILGAVRAMNVKSGHIIITNIEHPSVLDPCTYLETLGWKITRLAVNDKGLISVQQLTDAITAQTKLVAIMTANNEIGTVQPITELAAVCRAKGVQFHTDAAQACGKIPLNFTEDGLDTLSFSGHKIYGPKGVGALIVRRSRPKIHIAPIQFGGGQERGLRPGTLPTPTLVGLGAATALCESALNDGTIARQRVLRDTLSDHLLARLDNVSVNGSIEHRLPNNLNVRFDGIDASALIVSLPTLQFSTGSACTSETLTPSKVLTAIGLTASQSHESIRIGIGRFTTAQNIEDSAELLISGVTRLRALSAQYKL